MMVQIISFRFQIVLLLIKFAIQFTIRERERVFNEYLVKRGALGTQETYTHFTCKRAHYKCKCELKVFVPDTIIYFF